MNLEQLTIKWIERNFTETDKLIYKTPAIKLASLLAGKTKVIAKT